jgi:hypothetical protein
MIDADKFWAKVKRGEPNECWEYQGARHDRDRYGMHCAGGKMLRAHRVAWEIENGPIPEGLCALHKCDNRPCCNPNHLFLGTKKRNMEDAKEKKRHAFGSRHGRAILNEALVRMLREQYHAGATLAFLAEMHGIKMSLPTLLRAVNGQSWKHVPMPEHSWRREQSERERPEAPVVDLFPRD